MRDKNSVRLEKVITYLEDERLNSRQKEIIQMLELYGEITIKALAERLGIERVEERGGQLTFVTPKPDLAMWSEAFAKYPGMRFSPSGDRVIFRHTDAECAKLAERILITCLEAKTDGESEK